jgi:hypothetical protein
MLGTNHLIQRIRRRSEPSESDDDTAQPQRKQRKKQPAPKDDEQEDSEFDPAFIMAMADRQLIDDFVQRIHALAQEAVTGQSKFSANELLELAGYRMGTKARRSAFNKVNPFNLFLQESKTAENIELRGPAQQHNVAHSANPAFRSVTLQSDGYGPGFYKIMGNNGCALDRFETMCRGGSQRKARRSTEMDFAQSLEI